IFSKSADSVVNIASVSKVLTALTVGKWVTDFSATRTVVAGDLTLGGSTANLQDGDVLTLSDLMYGLALPSGNDAAMCLARHVGQILLDAESGGSGNPITRF